jgi:hypothetical protein
MVPTPRGPYPALVVVGPAGEVLLLPVRMGAVSRARRRGRSQELCFTNRTLTRIVARINDLTTLHNSLR